jgi:predicted DNA-binding transcriptional regulator AlpA
MENVTPLQNQEIGFYRVPQITELLSISKSTWWLLVQTGRAPQGKKITNGVTVWSRSEIHKLIREIEQQGDDDPTPPANKQRAA